ncbi:MAG: hypothetical protein U0103_19885 [Candidatus Obscuribacterales bacterium]
MTKLHEALGVAQNNRNDSTKEHLHPHHLGGEHDESWKRITCEQYGINHKNQRQSSDEHQLKRLFDRNQEKVGKTELPPGKVAHDGSIVFEAILGKIAIDAAHKTTVAKDGSVTVEKPNNTHLKHSKEGNIIEIQYENGGKTKFEYFDSDQLRGSIKTITRPDGKSLHRGKYGEWVDDKGVDTGIHNLNLNTTDGSYAYLDKNDHIVMCDTNGGQTISSDTREQLDQKLVQIHEELNHTAFGQPFANGDRVNEIIQNTRSGDRFLLAKQYELIYGTKLTDDISTHLNTQDNTRANEYLNLAALQHDATYLIPNSSKGRERDHFIENMNAFLERAHQQGLTADEIARTFASTQRILESTTGKVSAALRQQLAEQIMAQAAHPESISQGQNLTCNVTDIEVRTWAKHPAVMANIVADVAIDGFYTARDGKVIQIPIKNLIPDLPDNRFTSDQQRSFASQLIQAALLNDISQRSSTPRFFSHIPRTTQQESGNHWTDADGNILLGTDGKPLNFSVGFGEIVAEAERITGAKQIVFANESVDNSEGVITFNSEQDLKNQLEQAAKDGRMPIIFAITDGDPLLRGPYENGDESKDDRENPHRNRGGHVVCIDSYDPETGLVQLDNTWGINDDKFVSVHELYLASN